ncbi:MAG: hypothetical protein FJ137_19045 [Deltaproteobacteria bacterium]|nr:hypothetical protein [Deltaproteobacteria bacterium]
MAGPGKVVVEIGKALGKAVIAGLGLELARVATKAVKSRFGAAADRDDDDSDDAPKAAPARDTADDVATLRRENAALRAELDALRSRRDG